LELTKEEEEALKGEKGEVLELAYRILVATGEATDAQRLIPIQWAHLSGVNYNTIGDPGEEFLKKISQQGVVKVKTTLNPMGFDKDSVSKFDLSDEFIQKQNSIKDSYSKMGVITSFSCIPYEIFDMPSRDSQVSFAESNAAIFVNSISQLKTNKESAFSALASALTGKSPYSDLRMEEQSEPKLSINMKIDNPSDLVYGMLGYFVGKIADNSVSISGINKMDKHKCKSLCGGMGTSGKCGKFVLSESPTDSEVVDFDEKEMSNIYDELNTADTGDIITFGSPQLGLEELSELSHLVKGKSFKKRCLVFCPRAIQNQAKTLGYFGELERAGCEILSDCCTCLTPLVTKEDVDSVITNSIKGAYYFKNSNGLDVNLKSTKEILKDETK